MPYVKVLIDYEEERALTRAAIDARRYPPQQIAFVLRQWLERENLLPPTPPPTTPTTEEGYRHAA